MALQLTSAAFEPGQTIPKKYTGEGTDASPPLAWADPPAGTQQLALLCDDPDAPTPEPWVHWVIYGIGSDVRSLAEGIPNDEELDDPAGARQGQNSWDTGITIGYRGPMPPPGHGVHHYHFKLFALDTKLDLAPAATKEQLLQAIEGRVLEETELIGTFERTQ